MTLTQSDRGNTDEIQQGRHMRNKHIGTEGSQGRGKDELAEVCLMLREQCLFAEREKKIPP